MVNAKGEETAAYMREYYRAHSTRQPMSERGAGRQRKTCQRCGVEKGRVEFTVRQTGPRIGHLAAHCKMCNVKKNGAAYKEKHARDPTIYRRCEWPSKLKRLYGITVADYDRMLLEQGGGCAICQSKIPRTRMYKKIPKTDVKFSVDHCHQTGLVRGLLCSACNRVLGLIGDDPDIAKQVAIYLTKEK